MNTAPGELITEIPSRNFSHTSSRDQVAWTRHLFFVTRPQPSGWDLNYGSKTPGAARGMAPIHTAPLFLNLRPSVAPTAAHVHMQALTSAEPQNLLPTSQQPPHPTNPISQIFLEEQGCGSEWVLRVFSPWFCPGGFLASKS